MRGSLRITATAPDGRTLAARLEDGRLEDLLIDPRGEGRALAPGAIWRALPGRPMKGLGGAMVELGRGLTGFLREADGLRPRAPLLVQISGHAEPGKAPPVTRRVALRSRLAVATFGTPGISVSRTIRAEAARARLLAVATDEGSFAAGPHGLVLRSAARDAPEAEIRAALAALAGALRALLAPGEAPGLLRPAPAAAEAAEADWPAPDLRLEGMAELERHGVREAIAGLLRPRAELPGGAFLLVEPTRALVAVDVNTGGDLSPAAGLKANLAAMRELPRQLRLRGLGGQVVVDPAALAKRERPQAEAALRQALKADPVETAILGWTQLGHLEILRRRERLPLAETGPDFA